MQDFRRRYEGTFVKLAAPSKGIDAVAKMVAIQEDESKFAVLTLDTREFGRIQTCFGSEEWQIKFDYPQAGVFQAGTDAMIYRRRCERQYVRGISSGNSTLEVTTRNIVGNNAVFSLFNMECAFKHSTYSVNKALQMLDSGVARSVALENNFSVALPMKASRKEHLIFHWSNPVARIDGEGKLQAIYETLYAPLVEEVLQNG